MKRRTFLVQSSLIGCGLILKNSLPSFPKLPQLVVPDKVSFTQDQLYQIFKNPSLEYRPYVRWWWNGNKIEKAEILRELKLLKEAGIGGVEINPISFPQKTSELNINSIEWLSNEWIELLRFTLVEANKLNLTCDLLIGTGFPFGTEYLEAKDCSQIVVIGVKKLEGPLNDEISLFTLFKEADPAIASPYSGRQMEALAVKLVPDPIHNIEEAIDLSDQIKNGVIKLSMPKGKFAIYSLIKVEKFMRVIQGAPGGAGPVLNHFDKKSVKGFLDRISNTIQNKIGPLAPYLRSFFVDSMETEGTNWSSDMREEFKKRRGYDLYPYLPFLLFKIGVMGNTYDYKYTAEMGLELTHMIARMRYDFELTKTELFHERFVATFAQWCKDNKIKSRAQAYGRGYFPLEGSFDIDIPECETWLKYGIGEDIPDTQFSSYPWHLGRSYTMICKYVSSSAHLKDKKLISSEEFTNTTMVFNESLETFKIAGDQSTIAGVTHPIFHGFNYSPPDAPFPGWITYGGYFNEKNTMWPYFNHYTDYRTRISVLLQSATMFADIALLPAIADLWSMHGAQNEPFPTVVYPPYQMLIWESIHQNGNACDYISEQIIQESEMKNGYLHYGKRKYHTLFLIKVESLEVSSAKKLYDFISKGGRIFCIETIPNKSPGWYNHVQKDQEVIAWIDKIKNYKNRFILLNKPDKDNIVEWYKSIQNEYAITPYIRMKHPHPSINQVRYQTPDKEILFFSNSSKENSYEHEVYITKEITARKKAWIWDAITGERYKVKLKNDRIILNLHPAASLLLVFDQTNQSEVSEYKPISIYKDKKEKSLIDKLWSVEMHHSNGSLVKTEFTKLTDLKDLPEYVNFSGRIIYKTSINIEDKELINYLNLGKVHGISIVKVNGENVGIQWYGKRIYPIKNLINGINFLEIEVITVMVNYMKSLKENVIAQRWTNEKKKNQPLQSMGLIGPVTIGHST